MDMWDIMRERYERYGRDAARAGIPYAANPYKRGTAAYLAWSQGHNAYRVMVACHRNEYPSLFERSHPTKPADKVN